MVLLGIVTLSAVVLSIPALTALGARRRGASVPLAALAGLVFPITWALWYLRDR